jgi:murein L,D-transpeptidase YafK
MKRRRFLLVTAAIFLLFALAALLAWQTGLARRVYFSIKRGRAPEVTERPIPNPKIVIEKSKRRLTLFSNGEVHSTWRIGLGFSPEGDKVKKGDGKTPEGLFYVCGKNPRSPFYLALNLSYPMIEDAERGLREGIIDRREHDRIVKAIEHRRQPPWDTKLGGAILIHGDGSRRDWTLGCVALDNDDMLELYESVPVGTTVTIHP